jgi:aspartate ammonia-lyase
MEFRIEKDSLGECRVPETAYYGAQTARALENFNISGMRVSEALVENYALLKMLAAEVLHELGLLDEKISKAIAQAAKEVFSGELRDQFPVDVFHSGAGTSFHMNINEVLAGRANEILGAGRGGTSPVHPNDHVNMSQSTNDTFPTVLQIAARKQVENLLRPLRALEDTLAQKGNDFQGVVKAGRTHLQDAVPVTLGQEFAAYAIALGQSRVAIQGACHWLEELGIGGSAAGTGLNAHPQFRFRLIEKIARHTGLDFRPASDMRASMQSPFAVSLLSSCLRSLALELSRIANDLRLLSSGPATGLGEIDLPPVQPGSSIMPGKVNPSIAEMVNMVCFQVIGNDAAIAWAAGAGQLELNVMLPVMAHNILQSIGILSNAIDSFRTRCVAGITARVDRCKRYADASTALATVLNPVIGYDRAAAIVREALSTNRTIVEVARERSGIGEEELEQLFDVYAMAQPRSG